MHRSAKAVIANAKFLKRAPTGVPATPRLSVVVPAYNAAATIEDVLRAIKGSTLTAIEVIVVDDASGDQTAAKAGMFADTVIVQPQNRGRIAARRLGAAVARSDLIAFVDSDVVVASDTLERLLEYMERNRTAAAVTGLLSAESAGDCRKVGFFSDYKNLYMNFIFSRLPQRVSFIYGSLFAVRRGALKYYTAGGELGDDTEFGQNLACAGYEVHFSRDLEVSHLKRYSLASLLQNDFLVPHHWARIFLKYRGLRQLGHNGTGFAHSPVSQLCSLVLLAALWPTMLFKPGLALALWAPLWLASNASFFRFLSKKRGNRFAVAAGLYTLLDQHAMALGVISGFLRWPLSRPERSGGELKRLETAASWAAAGPGAGQLLVKGLPEKI